MYTVDIFIFDMFCYINIEQAGFDNEDITEKEEEGKEDTADISSHKNEDEDKIYTVATDQTLRSLMTEYKKRKQTSTMPTSSFVKATRTRPISDQPPKKPSADIIDRQVEEQQRSSIMKVCYLTLTCYLIQDGTLSSYMFLWT